MGKMPSDLTFLDHSVLATTSGVTRGRHGKGGPPQVTASRGWLPNEINFLWLNLQRTPEKQRWKVERVGVVMRR